MAALRGRAAAAILGRKGVARPSRSIGLMRAVSASSSSPHFASPFSSLSSVLHLQQMPKGTTAGPNAQVPTSIASYQYCCSPGKTQIMSSNFSTSSGGNPVSPSTTSGDPSGGNQSPYIVQVNQENFQAIVQGSITTPTILKFSADWCGPCKQLAPLVEKAVIEADGRLILANVDADEERDIAAMLKVTSLPAVFALHGGQIVDHFLGAKSQAELVPFFDNLLQLAGSSGANASADDDSKEAALARATEMLISSGDIDKAAVAFKEILSRDDVEDSELMAALATGGLLQCAMVAGDAAAVTALVDLLRDKHSQHLTAEPTLSKLVGEAKLFLTTGSDDGENNSVAALESKVGENPKDVEAWHELALARLRASDHAGAVDAALKVVRLDKSWNEGAGRKICLEIFDALGEADPITQDGRRRLTNLIL